MIPRSNKKLHPVGSRFISACLLGVLLFNFSFPPAVSASIWQERQKAASSLKSDLELERKVFAVPAPPASERNFDIDLPEGAGSIVESWSPAVSSGAAPLVIHIQDAHGHYAAQKNLARILHVLKSKSNEPLQVYVEGAWGKIDTAYLGAIPEESRRRTAAANLLKLAKISGEEYASILHPGQFVIQGVEDASLYRANVAARNLAQGSSAKEAARLKLEMERLVQIKAFLFPKNIRDWDRARQEYAAGKLGLREYLRAIEKDAPGVLRSNGQESLREFMEVSGLEERVALKDVEKEREAFFKLLSDKFSGRCPSDLVRLSLEYRMGSASALSLYSKILVLARAYDFNAPHMAGFVTYLERSRQMNLERVDEELGALEKLVESQLIQMSGIPQDKEAEVRSVLRESRDLEMESRFLTRMVSPAQWSNDGDKIWKIRDQKLRFMIESYFQLALKRNQVLVDNMAQLHPSGEPVVLVAGGFHTPGITRRLREKSCAYIVIRPSLNMEKDELFQESSKLDWNDFRSAYWSNLKELSREKIVSINTLAAEKILGNLHLADPFLYAGKLIVFGSCEGRSPPRFAFEFLPKNHDIHTLRAMSSFIRPDAVSEMVPMALASILASGRAGDMIREIPGNHFLHDRMKAFIKPASIFNPYRNAVDQGLLRPDSIFEKTAYFAGHPVVTSIWEFIVFRLIPVFAISSGVAHGNLVSIALGASQAGLVFPALHPWAERWVQSKIFGQNGVNELTPKENLPRDFITLAFLNLFFLSPMFFAGRMGFVLSLSLQLIYDLIAIRTQEILKQASAQSAQLPLDFSANTGPAGAPADGDVAYALSKIVGEIEDPLLLKWKRILERSSSLGVQECADILNIARIVHYRYALNAEVLSSSLQPFGFVNRHMVLLSKYTVTKILEEVESGEMPSDQATQILDAGSHILTYARSSLIYRHGLSRVSVFRQNVGYVPPPRMLEKKSGSIMEIGLIILSQSVPKFISFVWGFTPTMFLMRNSFFGAGREDSWFYKLLFKEGWLAHIASAGNQVEAGLYPDIHGLEQQLNERFDNLKIQKAEYDNEVLWFMRKMASRLLPFLFFSVDWLVPEVVAYFSGVPASFTPGQFVQAIIKGVGLSIALSWGLSFLGMFDRFHYREKQTLSRLEARLEALRSFKLSGKRRGSLTPLEEEWLETIDPEKIAFEAKSCDLIIIVSPVDESQGSGQSGLYKTSEGVPVLPLRVSGKGDGARYLEAIKTLQSQKFKRALIILTEGSPSDSMSATLAKLNGFKATLALEKMGCGGVVVLSASEPFVSPLGVQKEGWTLFSSWTNYRDLMDKKMDLLVVDTNGHHAVRKQYLRSANKNPDRNLLDMKNQMERDNIRKLYSLDKPALQQMQTPTGGFAVSFRTETEAREFFELQMNLYHASASGNPAGLPIYLRKDIIGPMIVLSNGEDRSAYFNKFKDKDGNPLNDHHDYHRLHMRLREAFNPVAVLPAEQRMKVSAAVPYVSRSEFYFSRTQDGAAFFDAGLLEERWSEMMVRMKASRTSPETDVLTGHPRAASIIVSSLLFLAAFMPVSAYAERQLGKIASSPAVFRGLPLEDQNKIRETVLTARINSEFPTNTAPDSFLSGSSQFGNWTQEAERPQYMVVNLDGLVSESGEYRASLELILKNMMKGPISAFQPANPSGIMIISKRSPQETESFAQELGVAPRFIKAIVQNPDQAHREIIRREGRIAGILCSQDSSILAEMKKYFGGTEALLLSPFAALDQELVIQGPSAVRVFEGLEREGVSDGVSFDPLQHRLVLEGRKVNRDIFGEIRKAKLIRTQA